MRLRVYVAGPISKGDRYMNIHNGIMAGRELVSRGYAPLIPHLTHFADPNDALTWEAWLQVDEAWLINAQAILRLPGESVGSDREVTFCQEHGIPVVHSIDELDELYG